MGINMSSNTNNDLYSLKLKEMSDDELLDNLEKEMKHQMDLAPDMTALFIKGPTINEYCRRYTNTNDNIITTVKIQNILNKFHKPYIINMENYPTIMLKVFFVQFPPLSHN